MKWVLFISFQIERILCLGGHGKDLKGPYSIFIVIFDMLEDILLIFYKKRYKEPYQCQASCNYKGCLKQPFMGRLENMQYTYQLLKEKIEYKQYNNTDFPNSIKFIGMMNIYVKWIWWMLKANAQMHSIPWSWFSGITEFWNLSNQPKSYTVLKAKNPMHCLLQSREQHTVPDETHPNWEGGWMERIKKRKQLVLSDHFGIYQT